MSVIIYAFWGLQKVIQSTLSNKSVVVIVDSVGWLYWDILGIYWFLEIELYQVGELFCVWLSEISFCQNGNVLAKQKFGVMNLVNRM